MDPSRCISRDYWETYAPVVTWSFIHLILILPTIMQLKSHQVDYTQAFHQVELHDPVFMRPPQGWFVVPNGVLLQHSYPKHSDTLHYVQLHHNLYGCKQAAYNWYHHLNKGILAQGFYQSKIDPCLYLWSDCIMIFYTDDTLIFAREDSIIDEVVKNLSLSYNLEDQEAVSDFLGTRISTDSKTKTITMTQPGLIESILQDLGFHSSTNMKYTPADSILYKDTNGSPRIDTWNFCSLIGKPNFLAQDTHPDISFSVHQCSCFSHSTTRGRCETYCLLPSIH
jgi:hypothetical protein